VGEPAELRIAPREHPILFSGEMVRAILSGRKTQTRRLVTPTTSIVDGQAHAGFEWSELDFSTAWVDEGPSPAGNAGPYLKVPRPTGDDSVHRLYPRWWMGEHLWVREAYALIWPGESEPADFCSNLVEYRADKPDARFPGEWPDCPESERDEACPKWRPSIHMPRWASRLTLEITDVRVERLQDIREKDATAEGFDPITRDCKVPKFQALWDSMYAKSAPWSSNPWVWVITFKRVDDAKDKP
jgi:hypothetical protein